LKSYIVATAWVFCSVLANGRPTFAICHAKARANERLLLAFFCEQVKIGGSGRQKLERLTWHPMVSCQPTTARARKHQIIVDRVDLAVQHGPGSDDALLVPSVPGARAANNVDGLPS
jgi:hypothetical protein